MLERGIRDGHEMPWLQVRAAGSAARHREAIFNHASRNWPVGKMADRAPPDHVHAELAGTLAQSVIRKEFAGRKRNRRRLWHA
jgi:hypothetical protein